MIYENEDILVENRISTYMDAERSATMLLHLKKIGLFGEQKLVLHFSLKTRNKQ